MADTITGTPNSEKAGSKFVVALSSVIAILGTLTELLTSAGTIFPPAAKGLGMWIAIGGIIVAGLTQIAYTIMRGFVKSAAIKAGQIPASGTEVAIDPAAAAANLGK